MSYYDTVSSVILYMTDRCNLNCPYCLNHYAESDYVGELKEEVLDYFPEFISQLKKENIQIVFFGGEPTLKWEECKRVYREVQERNPDKNFKFYLQTNGTNLIELLPEILQMDKMYVFVSYTPYKELHDKYRVYHDGSGSWEKVTAGVKLYLDNGLTDRIGVVYTYAPSESNTVYDVVRKLYDFGIRNIRASLIKEEPTTEQTLADMKEANMKIADFMLAEAQDLEYHKLGRFKIKNKEDAQYYYDMIYKENVNPFTCGAGRNKVFVRTNGNVYICSSLVNDNLVMGNVLTGESRFGKQVESLWKNPKCASCKLYPTCLACLHRSHLTTGTLRNTCHEYEEHYSRIQRECTDYLFDRLKERGIVHE